MFGYVRPLEPELKVKEAAAYKAHYCALCKAIGLGYGVLRRGVLSYDCAFLAIVTSALREPQKARREGCFINPIVKRPVMPQSTDFAYAAAVNVVMAYGKLDDDWRDERKPLALAGKAALGGAYRKAVLSYPSMGRAVEDGLAKLSTLERENCDIMDAAADAFATLMAQVFREAVTGRESPAMEWLGYNIGKWIYLADAYDDIAKDMERGGYNVLIQQFGASVGVDVANAKRLREAAEPRVRLNMARTLGEAAKALSLLEMRSNAGLIDNIVNFGCRQRMEQVLCGRKEECTDGSI